MKKLAWLLAGALVLSGCASGVARTPGSGAGYSAASGGKQLSAISILLTDEAKKKSADNLKFNPDELLAHVKRALDANSLVANGDGRYPDLEIQVKDMRVRSNFSAVMWGFMAGSDSITADVVIKEKGGRELDRYQVSVSYALGGLAGGQDSARMSWLYEKFAEETVKELNKP